MWSPDGTMLASTMKAVLWKTMDPYFDWGMCEAMVILWRANGTLLSYLSYDGVESRRENYVVSNAVAWSRDGTTLATSSYDWPIIELWQVNETRFLHEPWQDPTWPKVSSKPFLQAIDKDHPCIRQQNCTLYAVLSVAWSPDGTTLATGSNDKTIKLWKAGVG